MCGCKEIQEHHTAMFDCTFLHARQARTALQAGQGWNTFWPITPSRSVTPECSTHIYRQALTGRCGSCCGIGEEARTGARQEAEGGEGTGSVRARRRDSRAARSNNDDISKLLLLDGEGADAEGQRKAACKQRGSHTPSQQAQ